MSAFTDQLATDFRQLSSRDLPVSFRFRRKQYNNASFNPGESGYDPVAGGIIEHNGIATLMYANNDLPAREPEEDEPIEVLWQGKWLRFEVRTFVFGHAVATFTLMSPEKS